jgi:hypothetical protein
VGEGEVAARQTAGRNAKQCGPARGTGHAGGRRARTH